MIREIVLAALVAATPAWAGQPAPASAADVTPVSARVVTLSQALESALSRQPRLTAAQASTYAAMAQANQVLAAKRPQVTTSLGYSRSTANGTTTVGNYTVTSNQTDTYDKYSYSLTGSYLLYDFGQTEKKYQAALSGVDAQKENEKAVALGLTLSVRSAYYSARASKTMVSVAKQALENQLKHLKQIQSYVEVGMRAPIDLYQARTGVANARLDLISAQNDYATAKASLNQAMGVDDSADYDVTDETEPAVVGEDAGIDVLLEEALKARPEFAALSAQVRAKKLSLEAISKEYLPYVGLSAGFTGSAGSDISESAWNGSAGVTASWDLYSGGLTRAQEAEAYANLKNLAAQEDSLRQEVRLELEKARLAVRAAKASIAATAEAVAAARETLRLAEGRYTAGVGNVLELSDAQLTLTRAEASEVSAQYNLSQARSSLLKALGRMETASVK